MVKKQIESVRLTMLVPFALVHFRLSAYKPLMMWREFHDVTLKPIINSSCRLHVCLNFACARVKKAANRLMRLCVDIHVLPT